MSGVSKVYQKCIKVYQMQCAANAVTTRDCGLLGRGSIPLGVT